MIHPIVRIPFRQRNAQRGFSLVEILMVVVIIGMMMGIALPKSGLQSFRANSGAQAVASTLSYAQRQAISRQADTRVAFDVPNRKMRIHEDRNNDNVIDVGERVTYTILPDGITFGRGAAPARPMGGADVTFTKTQGGLPVLIFRRDGTASEAGGVYITTLDGLAVGRAADVRSVEVTRAIGHPIWFSYATGVWKERQ